MSTTAEAHHNLSNGAESVNPPQTSATDELTFEQRKFEAEQALENRKLRLEKTKAWLTAASIVLPLLGSIFGYILNNYLSRNSSVRQKEIEIRQIEAQYKSAALSEELEFRKEELAHQTQDRAMRADLLKMLVEKPAQRNEIIQLWKKAFPEDEWVNNLQSESRATR